MKDERKADSLPSTLSKNLKRKKNCVARHMYSDCWELMKPLEPEANNEKAHYNVRITRSTLISPLKDKSTVCSNFGVSTLS